jgi:hypothetical protein
MRRRRRSTTATNSGPRRRRADGTSSDGLGEENVAMSDEPDAERTARLIDELRELPHDEREAAIEDLSIEDRAAVWEAELEVNDDAALPSEDDELGGEA